MEGRVKQLELLANFWQVAFFGASPRKGKSENSPYLLVVGLGGLEPPTSPLSGAFMVLYV
jgi:hypothetical protein